MIEQDLKRIADALEGILGVVKGAAPVAVPAEPKKGINAVTPPAPAAPKAEAPKTDAKAQMAWPTNVEELRLMAQKIAQKCGPKTLEFTAWVTAELKTYGITKMVDMPSDKIIDMAVKLDAYAREKGINV